MKIYFGKNRQITPDLFQKRKKNPFNMPPDNSPQNTATTEKKQIYDKNRKMKRKAYKCCVVKSKCNGKKLKPFHTTHLSSWLNMHVALKTKIKAAGILWDFLFVFRTKKKKIKIKYKWNKNV